MSQKREDYITWDEYFVGLRNFPGSDRKIPVHRLVPALSVKIIRFLSMAITVFPKGVRMMNFPGKGM